MATYCQAGDTARVTFSDGEILNFNNSPLTITEKINYPDDPNCKRFVIYYSWNRAAGRTSGSKGISTPFGGIRVNTSNGTSTLEALCRGVDFNCGNYQWRSLGVQSSTGSSGAPSLWGESLNRINYYPGTAEFIVTKTFTITDALGSISTITKPQNITYSVECIAGCPPGTLDCGDCCLPCDEIFNQISGIRSLLSRIK